MVYNVFSFPTDPYFKNKIHDFHPSKKFVIIKTEVLISSCISRDEK